LRHEGWGQTGYSTCPQKEKSVNLTEFDPGTEGANIAGPPLPILQKAMKYAQKNNNVRIVL
jgi:hypothetical protein